MTRGGAEADGHSLWLLPHPAVRPALAGLIGALAAALRTPAFDPHVTLVGSALLDARDLVARARSLASGMRALDLHLTRVTTSARYFRALVIEVGRTDELVSARRRALAACEQVTSGRFAPHLSLAYGTFTPAERRALSRAVGGAFPGLGVAFTHLAVVRTRGPVERWRRVATFPLS